MANPFDAAQELKLLKTLGEGVLNDDSKANNAFTEELHQLLCSPRHLAAVQARIALDNDSASTEPLVFVHLDEKQKNTIIAEVTDRSDKHRTDHSVSLTTNLPANRPLEIH